MLESKSRGSGIGTFGVGAHNRTAKSSRATETDHEEFWGRHRSQDFGLAAAALQEWETRYNYECLLEPPGPQPGRKTRGTPTAAAGRIDAMTRDDQHEKPATPDRRFDLPHALWQDRREGRATFIRTVPRQEPGPRGHDREQALWYLRPVRDSTERDLSRSDDDSQSSTNGTRVAGLDVC